MKNRKSQSFWIVLPYLFIICFFLTGIAFTGWRMYQVEIHSSCFDNIGKKYCEDRGYSYGRSYLDFGDGVRFNCRESFRSTNTLEYKFTESEIDKCLGG